MANIYEIKSRMKGIKETRQITKAMKLISAAKLKKARWQLEQTMPFFTKVRTTLADILPSSEELEDLFFDQREEKPGRRKCYLIMTGDKSLAGGYNNNIERYAEGIIDGDKEALLLVAGQLGRAYFIKRGYNVDQKFDYIVQNPTVYRAREIAEQILDLFASAQVDEVHLIYTKMVSAIKLEPRDLKLLPLELEAMREDLAEDKIILKGGDQEPIKYEPSMKSVFRVLVPKYLKGTVYGALVEAFTSEQSARMTAMDNATSNADEILEKLTLDYNRARQAAITQEISEIVGGAEALR